MRKVPPELGEWVLRRTNQPSLREALSVRVSHRFTAGSARFDEDNLVSHAGLVPLLGLAEQTGLPEIIAGKVSIPRPRIKSGSANPAPKLLSVVAGMCAGADSIDDLDMLRAGGMPIVFDGVYAPSTLGTLLREFSFCCARSTGTPNRAPPTDTPRSPASRCCARASHRWPPRSAPNTAPP